MNIINVTFHRRGQGAFVWLLICSKINIFVCKKNICIQEQYICCVFVAKLLFLYARKIYAFQKNIYTVFLQQKYYFNMQEIIAIYCIYAFNFEQGISFCVSLLEPLQSSFETVSVLSDCKIFFVAQPWWATFYLVVLCLITFKCVSMLALFCRL